jgi:molybdopterin synthase sulfur carrier subunit
MIRLLYFARLRETLGSAGEILESTPATVADLLAELSARGDTWQDALSGKVLVAVNQEMALQDTALADGDEVGLFPPVTGG